MFDVHKFSLLEITNAVFDDILRPAWVEIDLERLRQNFRIINKGKSAKVSILSVVKDQAYGHGAVPVARMALKSGASYLAVATIDEALELRLEGISSPILVFGERSQKELPLCIDQQLSICINDISAACQYARLAAEMGQKAPVHLEVDTGLNRYGIQWQKALTVVQALAGYGSLHFEGIMSHFAMSDELDKTFALVQLERFQQLLRDMEQKDLRVKYRHMCNSGGFLDLPQAHFDMVRIGILPLGVYPSQVCRRISGLEPVMSVKARVAAIREVQAGDSVGYGMHYHAASTRRIAVIPLGYGDGFPRVRNRGRMLIHNKYAPIIGGNAMDATMVDITDIPETKQWDPVVVLGKQGDKEITVQEIAALKGTVTYDVMTGFSWRLPRVYYDKDK